MVNSDLIQRLTQAKADLDALATDSETIRDNPPERDLSDPISDPPEPVYDPVTFSNILADVEDRMDPTTGNYYQAWLTAYAETAAANIFPYTEYGDRDSLSNQDVIDIGEAWDPYHLKTDGVYTFAGEQGWSQLFGQHQYTDNETPARRVYEVVVEGTDRFTVLAFMHEDRDVFNGVKDENDVVFRVRQLDGTPHEHLVVTELDVGVLFVVPSDLSRDIISRPIRKTTPRNLLGTMPPVQTFTSTQLWSGMLHTDSKGKNSFTQRKALEIVDPENDAVYSETEKDAAQKFLSAPLRWYDRLGRVRFHTEDQLMDFSSDDRSPLVTYNRTPNSELRHFMYGSDRPMFVDRDAGIGIIKDDDDDQVYPDTAYVKMINTGPGNYAFDQFDQTGTQTAFSGFEFVEPFYLDGDPYFLACPRDATDQSRAVSLYGVTPLVGTDEHTIDLVNEVGLDMVPSDTYGLFCFQRSHEKVWAKVGRATSNGNLQIDQFKVDPVSKTIQYIVTQTINMANIDGAVPLSFNNTQYLLVWTEGSSNARLFRFDEKNYSFVSQDDKMSFTSQYLKQVLVMDGDSDFPFIVGLDSAGFINYLGSEFDAQVGWKFKDVPDVRFDVRSSQSQLPPKQLFDMGGVPAGIQGSNNSYGTHGLSTVWVSYEGKYVTSGNSSEYREAMIIKEVPSASTLVEDIELQSFRTTEFRAGLRNAKPLPISQLYISALAMSYREVGSPMVPTNRVVFAAIGNEDLETFYTFSTKDVTANVVDGFMDVFHYIYKGTLYSRTVGDNGLMPWLYRINLGAPPIDSMLRTFEKPA